jgi:catechol 2,3-dioxygenase-like lactoylglutathione lyase family enzyme
MHITQCLHTALLVSNLEQAEHFYGTILGLPKINRTLNYAGVWYQVGNYQIHLIIDGDYSPELQNTEKWGRNPHIALRVDSIEEAKKQLQADNYPFQMSASGRPALFTQDPDGNIIEISQT